MNIDERLEQLTGLPEMDDEYARITRVYRPNGSLGWELKLFRSSAQHTGALHFFGHTIHEALCGAEKELLKPNRDLTGS
jgi:hypothetical protein